MNEQKIAVVTGGSSGIGRETALELVRRGCRVYEFSRHDAAVEQVQHITCDVSQEADCLRAMELVRREAGRIDILVCNAGFGISGAAEFTENAQAEKLLSVNLFGVVNCCKAVIPIMRAQGGGRIVATSSVAAVAAIPFQSWYSVSKAAVSAYTAALYNEVRPFGISVAAVLPGDIRTGFTAAREKNPVGDDIYGGRIARSVSGMEHDEQTGMSPAKAGKRIADIALRRRVKPEYSIGLSYQILTVLAHCLPSRLKAFIIGLLYAK